MSEVAVKWFIQIVYVYKPEYSVVGFWRDELDPSGGIDWEKSAFDTDVRSATHFSTKEDADRRRIEIHEEVFRRNCSGDLMVCAFDADWTPYHLYPESATLFDRLQLPRKLPAAPKS